MTEAAGVGLSGPRVYRIYQSITAVLLVIVFIIAGYFVGLVGVNINGAAPPDLPDRGLHWFQECVSQGCVRTTVSIVPIVGLLDASVRHQLPPWRVVLIEGINMCACVQPDGKPSQVSHGVGTPI